MKALYEIRLLALDRACALLPSPQGMLPDRQIAAIASIVRLTTVFEWALVRGWSDGLVGSLSGLFDEVESVGPVAAQAGVVSADDLPLDLSDRLPFGMGDFNHEVLAKPFSGAVQHEEVPVAGLSTATVDDNAGAMMAPASKPGPDQLDTRSRVKGQNAIKGGRPLRARPDEDA